MGVKIHKHYVNDTQWCAAIRFLMGIGTKHPALTDTEQRWLATCLRGRFKNGTHTATQAQALLLELGWERR